MSTYLRLALMTVVVVLFASLVHAEPILPYSATGAVAIVDYQGRFGVWQCFLVTTRLGEMNINIQTDASIGQRPLRFVAEGIQFERRGEVFDASVGPEARLLGRRTKESAKLNLRLY